MQVKDSREQFLELFLPIKEKLYLYAYALTKNSEDAEDLVSDAILACLEKFEQILDYSCFKAYVFKSTRNIFRRKRVRALFFDIYDETEAKRLKCSESSPEINYDIQVLYAALDKLPAKQKEAVVLFEISGFSLEEIKNIQGGTLSGAKSRVKRGREKLALLLNENFIDSHTARSSNSLVLGDK